MTLARLVDELDLAAEPLSPVELAMRLGTTVTEVSGMIAALRAAGRLHDSPAMAAKNSCAASTGCMRACPGPAQCPLMTDPGIRRLEPHQ